MSYINLFYIFIVLAVMILILSIILFFVLDISNAVRIVNRKPPKKKRQKTVKNYNTGELKNKNLSQEETETNNPKINTRKKTTVLPNSQRKLKKRTSVLQQNQALVESQPQSISPKKKTTVLQNTSVKKVTGDMNANSFNNDIFEVIETTSFIASDKTI